MLAYWHEHNDSFAYSEKILDETEKAEKLSWTTLIESRNIVSS